MSAVAELLHLRSSFQRKNHCDFHCPTVHSAATGIDYLLALSYSITYSYAFLISSKHEHDLDPHGFILVVFL